MHKRLKRLVFAALIVCVIGSSVALSWPQLKARHLEKFKRAALVEITELAGNEQWVENQRLASESGANEDSWVCDSIIFTTNGEWIVYTNKCSKEDRLIGDIFVGKDSNGNIYESDYHFCKQMLTLRWAERPDSLNDFVSTYRLRKISP